MSKQLPSYRFAVYQHKLVYGSDRLINRNFIVLKDAQDDIILFTNLHRYIHSNKTGKAKSISDDGNNRFYFVAQFLNYVLIEKYDEYEVDKVTDITKEMIQDFFYAYCMLDENGIGRASSTIDQCSAAVTSFLLSYIEDNLLRCSLTKTDVAREETYYTKHGIRKIKMVPNFDIRYAGTSAQILRDIPDSVFQMVLSYAASYHKDILMLIALSAFGGLRPSEACNVRQEISPLGSGIMLTKMNNRVRNIMIDLREEKVLRKDLISVGRIKKERIQKIYPKFITSFMQCYALYKDYLAEQTFDLDYCPLSINRKGEAMTYATYRQKFQKMMNELIPYMIQHENDEIQEYGRLLMQYNISPHIFRHWFSVRLTLFGESAASLQYWRGDKNPNSANTYLQNKSELSKRFKEVNDMVFDLMISFATEKGGKSE